MIPNIKMAMKEYKMVLMVIIFKLNVNLLFRETGRD